MTKQKKVYETKSGRTVEFEEWGNAIIRFCPYCGSEDLETRPYWPAFRCRDCGLEFDIGDEWANCDTHDFNESGRLVRKE